ncbi:MAG: PilZ domain-containing protein [Planctomycetes bacterium]|nr:PilZ domain-containing protein [Planctomycetota bacterium]
MGWDGGNRRRKKRYALKNSALRYRKGGLLAFLFPSSAKYLLLNFSETGAHFISREELKPGQRLRLAIEAPSLRGTIHVPARVTWCRRSSEINAYRVGVRFGTLGGRSKVLLKNLLDSAILENIEISTKVYLKEIERL